MEDKKTEELTIEELKNKALLYGLQFKGNISKDKLITMVETAEQVNNNPVGIGAIPEDDVEYGDEVFGSKEPTRKEAAEIKRQALIMIKCQITNLNSEESDEQLIYAGVVTNHVVAARYIPADTPWMVEQCLIDKLMTEKHQTFVNEIDPRTRRPNGNKVAKLSKHYNVQFLR